MKDIKNLLKEQQEELFDRKSYISQEFQDYGYRLAVGLEDIKHKSLYIKLAKTEKRAFLEQAFSFAIDYPQAKNKAKIFMWKLKELRDGKVQKPKSGTEVPPKVTKSRDDIRKHYDKSNW